jgi:hypothetical protein
LTLTEAARQSRLSREAIRARARRGLIASQRGNRGELLVQLPATLLSRDDQDMSRSMSGLSMDMTDLMAELSELREQLARAESTLEAAKAIAAAERTAAVAEAQAKTASLGEALEREREQHREAREREREQHRALVDELKAMLAEARRPWWRKLLG